MSKIEPKKQSEINELLFVVDRYLVDLECLREMFLTVMPVLEEQDETRRKRSKEIIRRLNDLAQDNEDVSDKKRVLKEAIVLEADELVANIRKEKRAEILFAKQSIVSIVSRFDEFLGRVLEVALTKNPEWRSMGGDQWGQSRLIFKHSDR